MYHKCQSMISNNASELGSKVLSLEQSQSYEGELMGYKG